MTPRDSARVHLPELAETLDEIRRVFGIKDLHMVTPDCEIGTRPDWLDHPVVRADEYGPPWIPPKTGRRTA